MEARREPTNPAQKVLEQLPRERNHDRLWRVGGNDITTEVKVTVFKTVTLGLKPCQPKLIIHR